MLRCLLEVFSDFSNLDLASLDLSNIASRKSFVIKFAWFERTYFYIGVRLFKVSVLL